MSLQITRVESPRSASFGSRESRCEPEGPRPRELPEDTFTTASIPLASIWSQLVEGGCTVESCYFCAERCHLALRAQAQPRPAVRGRHLSVVEAILSGVCQNVVSIDIRLSPSSVATMARQALDALGAAGKPSRAHPLLMLAARAARDHDYSRVAALKFVDGPSSGLLLASVPRPDALLTDLVSPAELCVLRGLFEGRPYVEIARARGTSTRTIANQISSVFRRLAVSGRNELVHALFARSLSPSSAPAHAAASVSKTNVQLTRCSASVA